MSVVEVEPKISSEPKTPLGEQTDNAPELTQSAIDAEALAIAKRRMERHRKTWTELAKY